eukprot:Nitzschia sp. Nitz4//scaffold248_size28759//2010//3067//NITZ4_008104-RA/size28759-snap-gene-0.9-mRNA-1//-1//CDS//3329543977//9058//frame0
MNCAAYVLLLAFSNMFTTVHSFAASRIMLIRRRGARSHSSPTIHHGHAASRTVPTGATNPVPLCRCEGLFSVDKPLNWTSNDVVSYIRGILERDARDRGARPASVKSKRNKKQVIKVGHGGTLDPLASGVLVIGVGKGTKELQKYLSGSKAYRAVGEFGFETTTLDMEGDITSKGTFDHVTAASIEKVLPDFRGRILQVPPLFSAIRKNGKKLYQSAREGASVDDIVIDPREVHVMKLELVQSDTVVLPKFEVNIECGGGTFVRSLIRDIAYKLDTVATTTLLQRTKQGQFLLEGCLPRDVWCADTIYAAIQENNILRSTKGTSGDSTL